MTTNALVTPDAWNQLRDATPARIALGRSGGSLPTHQWLEFKAAHAAARDAVHNAFDAEGLAAEIAGLGVRTTIVDSAAPDRFAYLQRPELGRRLAPASQARLQSLSQADEAPELAIIVSDGLSALAAHRQTRAVLAALLPLLTAGDWQLSPIVIARFGRVALEDQVGQLLGAQIALMLIGERPGLGSPDSLGAYLVFDPRVGNTDANRNCVSNIRPEGLPPAAAALTLHFLLTEARRRRISGTLLKDDRALSGATANARLTGGE